MTASVKSKPRCHRRIAADSHRRQHPLLVVLNRTLLMLLTRTAGLLGCRRSSHVNLAFTRGDLCVTRTSCNAKVAADLSCIAMVFAQSAMAQAAGEQPPVFFGNEKIVTAGRISQRLADALRNVILIRAEDIARSGQLTLAQVLQQFGGLEVASNFSPCQWPSG